MKTLLCIGLLTAFLPAAVAAEGPGRERPDGLYIDASDEALARLDQLAAEGDWTSAAEAAQKLIAEAYGKFFEVESGLYVPLAEKVRRAVCSWPEPGVRAYRTLFDDAAGRLFEAARREKRISDLAEVARLYLPSSWGAASLVASADIRAQRGELREATRLLRRALELAPDEAVRTKLAAVDAALAGEPDPHMREEKPFDIGLREWSFDVPDADVDAGVAAGLRKRGFRVPGILHPVVEGDRIILQTTQWIGAVDRATGRLCWRYPDPPAGPNGRYYADAFAAPVARRGRVFAFVAGEVVALSAASGERAWSSSEFAREEQAPDADANGPMPVRRVIVNSLAVADGKVFVCAAIVKDQTESVVTALDAANGAELWRVRLCSQAFVGLLGRGSDPAPPVFHEGTVYVSTNIGAVAAIDAETGEVRWLARYGSFTPARRQVALANDDRWENGPPLVVRGLLLAAPQDSDDLIAFDTATGRERWRHPRMGMRYLAGSDGAAAYVSGDHARAISINTGKVLWNSDETWTPAGRPTLTGHALLIPSEDALFRLDAGNGKLVSKYRLAGPRECGNIVVADGLLLSVSFDRVDAYGDLAEIPKKKPEKEPGSAAEDEDEESAHADDATLTTVWRTPFAGQSAAPAVLPESEPPFLLMLTESRPDWRKLSSWDTIERRRVEDGRVVWRTEIGECKSKAHHVGDRLVVCSLYRLVALDVATGRVVWTSGPGEAADDDLRARLSGRIVDTADGDGKVFAATVGRELFAVDAENGDEVWRKKLDEPALVGSMCFYDGKLVVCGESPGTISWFDPANGEQTRRVEVDRPDSRLTDTPAVQAGAGRLCLVVGDREVRVCGLADGRTLWKAELPFGIGRIATTPDEKRVIVFPDRWSFGGEVTCFDAATGAQAWSAKPAAREPESVFVGNNLVVSLQKERLVGSLVAWRTDDGSAAWECTLPAKLVLDRVSEAGEFLVATGSTVGVDGDRSWAVVARRADGAVVKTMTRGGAAYCSLRSVGDTLLFCSSRGVEAYRMLTAGALGDRLAEALDAAEADVRETARLLAALGKYGAAIDLLDDALLAEPPEPQAFADVHEQLMAVREAACEAGGAKYDAPFFDVPPQMDGRLTEDWRRDRAAVLDRPRNIERVGQCTGRFWMGPNDLSAVMYLGWDAENLYLAVDVRDDVRTVHDFDSDEWRGDCLIVAIDPEHDRGYSLRGLDNVFWLGLAAKPQQEVERAEIGENNIKLSEDGAGVVYELVIPWADIGLKEPRAGATIGLNIMAIDGDTPENVKAVSWTPGLTQSRDKVMMMFGATPAWFGTIKLKER